ncbi:hypothetical protein [Plesiomonas shigelloides]|uniref:hypothetical protein n=1 Tax=Plesiomonas shigelloides TaxID=703 RepID=UPI000A11EFE7|nr:hypothetical protein [Plesiomonas shigelloides]
MSSIEVTKLINKVSFKLDGSYKKTTDKIKKMAGLWNSATSKYQRAAQTGKRIADAQTKSINQQTRAEIKASRVRKATIRADQIRYKQQIDRNKQFRTGLQRINAEFLKGNLSSKERAAHIGQLNKQYKSLNQQASKYNKTSSVISKLRPMAQTASTASRVGMAGAAAVGGAGLYAATSLYDKTKTAGQEYEALLISIENTFGKNKLGSITNTIANLAQEMGQPVIDVGKGLTNYASIVKALGIETNKAIDLYKKQSNMTAAYGMNSDQVAGFQYGLMQTMSSNTLEDFKQTMDWSPQIKGDLLAFVKKTMGISQKEFMENLTNGKYNFKDIWLKFVESSAPKYAEMAKLYKQSSMAADVRTSNLMSLGLYRIYETSGFQEAMKAVQSGMSSLASMFEKHSSKIGEIFGNLANVFKDLMESGISSFGDWLNSLSVEDIKAYFEQVKTGMTEFATAMSNLAGFINGIASFFGSRTEKGNQSASSLATTTIPNSPQQWAWNPNANLQPPIRPSLTKLSNPSTSMDVSNLASGQAWSRMAAPLSVEGRMQMKIDAEFNVDKLNDFVNYKITDYDTKLVNLVSGG